MNLHSETVRLRKKLAARPETNALAQDEALLRAVCGVQGHDPALCAKIFQLCRQALRLPEAENWLPALCTHLADRLFPDAAHPRTALSAAELAYLTLLESRMEPRGGRGEADSPLRRCIRPFPCAS